MKVEKKSHYISGCFTVDIPLVIFFLFFLGLPILVMALLGWNVSWWLGVSLFLLGLLLGFGVNIALYPLIMKLAMVQKGKVTLDGERVRWRIGFRWKEMDLNRPYWAEIAAGKSGLGRPNASISFGAIGLMIHLRGAQREEVLSVFPEPFFVKDLAILPEEGLWGFNFRTQEPSDRALFLRHFGGPLGHSRTQQTLSAFPQISLGFPAPAGLLPH